MVSFAGGDSQLSALRTVPEDEQTSRGESDFEQDVIANLRVGGIQNGRKHERLTFTSIDSYASPYIQARGLSDDADGAPQRVGLTIGPQYGTVGPAFIKEAARAAIHAGDIDLLCILAFAFDPAAVGTAGDEIRPYASGHEAHAHSSAGKVLTVLAQRGSKKAIPLAVQRLEAAIDAFGPERAHAVASCQVRLSDLVG